MRAELKLGAWFELIGLFAIGSFQQAKKDPAKSRVKNRD